MESLPTSSGSHLNVDQGYQKKREQKFEGFDFLRAVFAVIVVALHSNLFNIFLDKPGLHFISDILNLNIGYLAVPVFLQISLFLFYKKSEKTGRDYFFQKRLPKLISLYLFWSISKLIFEVLLGEQLTNKIIGTDSSLDWIDLIKFIISGGYTIFYFFFSLFFLSFITEVSVRCLSKVKAPSRKIKISYYLLIISCVFIFSFSVIDLTRKYEMLTSIINPLNFLPYVFTTSIVVQEFNAGRLEKLTPQNKQKLFSLLFLFLALAVLEWVLFKDFPNSRLFPHYARLSLVIGSWLLLYLTLLTSQRPSRIISLLSAYSLGIYGFHIFFIEHINLFTALFSSILGISTLIIFLEFWESLICSIFITWFFKKIKRLKNFV